MPNYEDIPATVVRRYYVCPKCGSQKLVSNGKVLYSDPLQYPHTCEGCGRVITLPSKQGDVVIIGGNLPEEIQ
jgi:transcription elongation factor Elf1